MTKTRKAKLCIYVPIVILVLSIIGYYIGLGLVIYSERESQQNWNEFAPQDDPVALQIYDPPVPATWSIGQLLQEKFTGLGLLSVVVGLITVPVGIRWLRQERKKKIIAAKM